MLFSEIYKEYPVNQEMIWLNNCGTTPASNWSVQKVSEFLQDYAKRGVLSETEKFGTVRNTILSILSGLIGSKPDELAITHHTAEGINFVAQGVPLVSGDEILLLENEYPSNVYPWQHWEEKGVTIRYIPSGKNPSEFIKNFQSMLSKNVKLLSISAVHWCTGMPLPIQEVGKICNSENILFCLDGAQGVGHVPIDTENFHIDFMSFPAWKWLLGPLGLGFFYVRRDKLDILKVLFKGTGSVKGGENYLPYKKELKETSERFEYSTPNYSDWIYVKAILEKLQELDFSKIQKRIYELANYLGKKLQSIGYRLASEDHSENSGIVVAYHPTISSTLLASYLKSKGVFVADRMGGVRFAPHIYNSEEQLDRVVELLKNYK